MALFGDIVKLLEECLVSRSSLLRAHLESAYHLCLALSSLLHGPPGHEQTVWQAHLSPAQPHPLGHRQSLSGYSAFPTTINWIKPFLSVKYSFVAMRSNQTHPHIVSADAGGVAAMKQSKPFPSLSLVTEDL